MSARRRTPGAAEAAVRAAKRRNGAPPEGPSALADGDAGAVEKGRPDSEADRAFRDGAPGGSGSSPEEARDRLVRAARRVFAERGFHGTTADHLIDAAGSTRGALYRDFADKRDLFRAVFIAVEESLASVVAAAIRPGQSPAEQRRASLRAFLRACLDPEVRRIVLLEGPVVLGWEEWRAIDARYSLGFVTLLLEAEIDAGLRPRQPIRPLAHLIVGAMNEAGLAVASARDPELAIEEFVDAVESLMGSSDRGPGL